MARTVEQIEAEIIARKATQAELNGLTSTSKTAIWKLWVYVVAFAIWTHESIVERFQEEIREMLSELRPGTLQWYQLQAKKYQHGDVLVYVNDEYQYDPIDELNQIVDIASASDDGTGLLRIKIAQLVGGAPQPLTPGELLGFTSYMHKIKFAGTNLTVISELADVLLLETTIYYDPQIPIATLQANVISVVESYIASLPFDGSLSLDGLEGSIIDVEGVKEVVLISASARPDAGTTFTGFEATYNPNAGHLVLDSASSVYDQVNYIANV